MTVALVFKGGRRGRCRSGIEHEANMTGGEVEPRFRDLHAKGALQCVVRAARQEW
jgi:hypothetical protein